MSKLTKVVLINWMYFQKTTLDITGNTAIVGTNGSGKSTIIDAIQMLLLGQKLSKFNSGANAEKRTLESYVRGHIDSDNKEYLRNGDVVTYLALEVEVNDQKHVFGINVEYKANQNRLMDNKYFYIKNCNLNEALFVTPQNYPKTYDEFSKEMKKEFDFVPFQTLMNYQNKIKDIFGLKSDSAYFKILSRAIGLKNITECDKFMNEFVLDESIIDVSEIRNIIMEMNKVNKTVEREREKLNCLEKIVNTGEVIKSDSERLNDLELRTVVASKIQLEQSIDSLEVSSTSLEGKIQEEINKKRTFEEANRGFEKTKAECQQMLLNISPDLPKKQQELENAKSQYHDVHISLNTFETRCNTEIGNVATLKMFKNPVFDEFLEYLKTGNYTTASAKKQFISFRNEASDVALSYSKDTAVLKEQLKVYKDKLVELNNIIAGLENNKPVYRKDYEDFKAFIKKGLYDKYNEDIEVKFLCEYLDISNDTWRDAIEGYLGAQRFYLIVPNKCYKDALRLYHSNNKFHSTRIINGNRLPNFDAEEGTLGQFILASNDTAMNYARYILNRVHCVKDIYELENYDIAITKDCMCYQNYSSWRINPNIYKESFIGQAGIKKQLEARREEYSRLNDETSELLREYQKYEGYVKSLRSEESFATSILEDSTLIISIDLDSQLYDEIEQLKKTIAFYKNNPRYLEIEFEISSLNKSIDDNNKLISECNSLFLDYSASIKSNNLRIDAMKKDVAVFVEELSKFNPIDVDKVSTEIVTIKISQNYIIKLKSDYKNLNNLIIKNKSDLENLMRDARDRFSINLEPKYELLSKYLDEKNKIDKNIFQFDSKLIEMQKSHRKLFFGTFLSQLEKSIEDAKTTIANLNSNLAAFPFGNDYYSIKTSITDNQDLKAIYEYAKAYNSENSDRGLFVDREVEDRERQKVENLLNAYMFSEDVNTQKIVVDYRNYLYFDVEVETAGVPGKKSLNKVIRSQSGGEVQVPFYILSGVAFKQTLDKRTKDALGIVLYDEAFDKMDSQRIQTMLQFYRDKLKLQIVLAAPGKLDSLTDNIETVLVVVRDGEKADVSDYTHEI